MKNGYNPITAVKRNYLLKQHKKYLDTDTWAGKREYVLKRDNYTCVVCHVYGGSLYVHHKTYKRHENEKVDDLITVCNDCHNLLHDPKI